MRRPATVTIFLLLSTLILSLGVSTAPAQTPEKPEASPASPAPADKTILNDPNRVQALELYAQGKYVDAMPLFEKVVADHPSDIAGRERWAWCIFAYAATIPDPETRKKARVRARAIALQAKGMGDNSQILQVMLEAPEDGSEPTFSQRKEVDDAMKAAEADFARGDLEKARQGYQRVVLLDPTNYEAALFAGDVYFKQHVYGSAGEWFAQAIKIDPNRETAYRYWGDALAALGKGDEARAKYIEAIIADPYNRRSSTGLTNWLQANKLALNTVQLKDGAAVSQKEGGGVDITLDSLMMGKNDPSVGGWIAYSGNRSIWMQEKFKKEFPNEPKYRRSLKEETEGLGLVVTVLKEQKDYKKKQKGLDPGLQALIEIQEAGLLEPFVLLSRADADIAKDYAPYREAHRENIRRYLNEFMVPKAPATTPK